MGMDPISIAMIGGSLGMIGGSMMSKMGAQKSAPAPSAPAATPAAPAADTPEEQARKRMLAMNSGQPQGQLTPAGGDQSTATVSRKTLLGQ